MNRDIKSENVLFKTKYRSLEIKVIDFGLRSTPIVTIFMHVMLSPDLDLFVPSDRYLPRTTPRTVSLECRNSFVFVIFERSLILT